MTTLSFKTYTIDTANLAPAAFDYLLQYGFAKSMQDCVAGQKKALADKGFSESEIDIELNDLWTQRLEAIEQGSIGIRTASPRKDTKAKLVAEVTAFLLKSAVKAKGKTLPKDKEQLAALIEKWAAMPKNAMAIAEEVARREALASESDDEGLDALLNDI